LHHFRLNETGGKTKHGKPEFFCVLIAWKKKGPRRSHAVPGGRVSAQTEEMRHHLKEDFLKKKEKKTGFASTQGPWTKKTQGGTQKKRNRGSCGKCGFQYKVGRNLASVG